MHSIILMLKCWHILNMSNRNSNFPLKFYYSLIMLYWFTNTCLVSSGSVTINDDSSVQILAEEACPVDNLDAQVVWPFYFGCVFFKEKFIFGYSENADFNISNFR